MRGILTGLLIIIAVFAHGDEITSSADGRFYGVEIPNGAVVTSNDLGSSATKCRSTEKLYLSVIRKSGNPKEVHEALYLLAKNYDLCGNPEESFKTLLTLTDLSKDGMFYYESLFRVAERYFSIAQYADALRYYTASAVGDGPGKTQSASIYKAGWSLLKLGRNGEAIAMFSTLLELPEDKFNNPDKAKTMKADVVGASLSMVVAACKGGPEAGAEVIDKIHGATALDAFRATGIELAQCMTEYPAVQCRCAQDQLEKKIGASEPNHSLQGRRP